MKIFNYISIITVSLLFLVISCGSDDYAFGETNVPTGLTFSVTPSTDGSGKVEVSYSAQGVLNNRVVFKIVTDPSNVVVLDESQYDSEVSPGTFTESLNAQGLHDFQAIYYAYSNGSVYDSLVENFSMLVLRPIPEDILQKMTNGTSKTWKWDKDNNGHLGVGPESTPDNNGQELWPFWYQAPANSKPDCLYDDVITLTKTSDISASMTLANQGQTFIHVDHQMSMVGQQDSEDACFDYDTSGQVDLNVVEAESPYPSGESTGLFINTGDLFFSYGLETNTYEVVSISDSEMYLRTVETAPDGTLRAWYLRFISEEGSGCPDGYTGNQAGTGSYQLVWEDNFDTDGSPCSNNWAFDTGAGGWGNNEAQYYTDRTENVNVSNGILSITALQETYNGSEYTSARLKTQDKFEFQYGRVEVRAKLPTNGGSWPAIWMLGANFPDVGWPACGEIDIMEHVGNNANTIINAIHTPSSFGNTVNVMQTPISNAAQFHDYAVEWTPDFVKFFVDNSLTYTYQPPSQNAETWPFNADMFLILNVAVGGTLGGNIPANFGPATMEIDYVRVYQK